MESICAFGSISKKQVNQDVVIVETLENRYRLLAVADGIGSHEKAEIGAQLACNFLREKSTESPDAFDLEAVFLALPEHLNGQVEASLLSEMVQDRSRAFGTTLLCALETEHDYRLGYVGNGAILHLRGNFTHFPQASPHFKWPWALSNLLNPHTFWKDGQNVLYKFISPYVQKEVSRPTILTITKDKNQFGEILIFCTDGLYSADQILLGRAEDDRLWIECEEKVITLLNYLRDFFSRGVHTHEALRDTIDFYLHNLIERQLIDDDCTLAIIISNKTLEYQHPQQKKMANVTH